VLEEDLIEGGSTSYAVVRFTPIGACTRRVGARGRERRARLVTATARTIEPISETVQHDHVVSQPLEGLQDRRQREVGAVTFRQVTLPVGSDRKVSQQEACR